MEDGELRATISPQDLREMREKFQTDLVFVREQISVLQARAAAMEAQLARIEPMVEARASRTEVVVMKMQVELGQLTKAFAGQAQKGTDQFSSIESMLKTLLERTENGAR